MFKIFQKKSASNILSDLSGTGSSLTALLKEGQRLEIPGWKIEIDVFECYNQPAYEIRYLITAPNQEPFVIRSLIHYKEIQNNNVNMIFGLQRRMEQNIEEHFEDLKRTYKFNKDVKEFIDE